MNLITPLLIASLAFIDLSQGPAEAETVISEPTNQLNYRKVSIPTSRYQDGLISDINNNLEMVAIKSNENCIEVFNEKLTVLKTACLDSSLTLDPKMLFINDSNEIAGVAYNTSTNHGIVFRITTSNTPEFIVVPEEYKTDVSYLNVKGIDNSGIIWGNISNYYNLINGPGFYFDEYSTAFSIPKDAHSMLVVKDLDSIGNIAYQRIGTRLVGTSRKANATQTGIDSYPWIFDTNTLKAEYLNNDTISAIGSMSDTGNLTSSQELPFSSHLEPLQLKVTQFSQTKNKKTTEFISRALNITRNDYFTWAESRNEDSYLIIQNQSSRSENLLCSISTSESSTWRKTTETGGVLFSEEIVGYEEKSSNAVLFIPSATHELVNKCLHFSISLTPEAKKYFSELRKNKFLGGLELNQKKSMPKNKKVSFALIVKNGNGKAVPRIKVHLEKSGDGKGTQILGITDKNGAIAVDLNVTPRIFSSECFSTTFSTSTKSNFEAHGFIKNPAICDFGSDT